MSNRGLLAGPSHKSVNEKKVPEPVVFKKLDNGQAQIKTIPAGEKPPARVFHPELRMGTEARQTETESG